MAIGRHIRVDILGDRSGTVWEGETWQTGISLVEGDTGGVFPNAVREDLPSFNAISDSEVEDDTTWDIYWAWRGTDKMTRTTQLGIANAALAFWNGIRANAPSDSRMMGVRINAVQADGKVVNGGNYFYLKSQVAGGGNAVSQHPAQLAVVMSLRTGARGAGGRGRMYLPLTAITLSTGRIGTTQQNTITAAGKAFLEALHTYGPVPAIVNARKLQYSAIDRVAVGDLMDVQRRRRESVPEVYVEGDLSYN